MRIRTRILVSVISLLLIGAIGIDGMALSPEQQDSLTWSVAFTPGKAVPEFGITGHVYESLGPQTFAHLYIGVASDRLSAVEATAIQARSLGVLLGWAPNWSGWRIAPKVQLLRLASPPEIGIELRQVDTGQGAVEWRMEPLFQGELSLLSFGAFEVL